MTIEQFSTQHNGKIFISIVPNGITADTNNKPSYCFSLITGLKIEKDFFDLPIDDAVELMESFQKKINDAKEQFKLIIVGNPDHSYQFDSTKIFTDDHFRRWKKLLNGFSFFMSRREQNANTKIAKEYDQVLPTQAFFLEADVASTEAFSKSLLLSVKNVVTSSEHKQKIDERILQREKVYDSIANQGRIDAANIANKKRQNLAWAKNRKDLLLLINSIYQHPYMARYYGLIYDFNISSTDEQGKSFISEYVKENNPGMGRELKLRLEIKDPFSSFFLPDPCNAGPDVKNEVSLYNCSKVLQNDTKYYHGTKNWGCVLTTDFTYVLVTVSPDHAAQNEKLISDTFAEIQREGKRLMEPGDVKRRVTEGIYLIRIPLRTTTPVKTCGVGTLGYAVAVRVTDGPAIKLASLCKRKALYHIRGSADHSPVEEGWVHHTLTQSSTGGELDIQTICHWMGHNLCVPKPGKHNDQPLTEHEKNQAGGHVGLYENEEEKVMDQNGYKVEYKLLAGSDIQLIENMGYQFILRHVFANGYVLPLFTSKGPELSIEDLLSIGDMNSDNLLFGEKVAAGQKPKPFVFSLAEDTLNAPTLLGNKKYEEKGDKTSQSNVHLVILNTLNTDKRFVFPPIIDVQFAHYLGLLSKKMLKATTEQDYKEKGKKMTKRGAEKIPEFNKNNGIDYLPDIRGKSFTVTAGDWFTRYLLLKEKQGLALTEDNLFDFSLPDKNFSGLKPGVINVVDSNTFKWQLNNRRLLMEIGAGLQLKFFIQLHENEEERKNEENAENFILKNDAFKIFSLSTEGKFLPSGRKFLQYAKGQFQVTRARKKPQKPLVTLLDPGVQRPTKPADDAKAFYAFKIDNAFPYLQTVKQFQVLSTSVILNDDHKSVPGQDQIDRGLKSWTQRTKGKNFTLLNNELPEDIFIQTATLTEKEVYRNNFGFNIMLDEQILTKSNLSKGNNLVHLNISNGWDIFVRYQNNKICDVVFGEGDGNVLNEVDLTQKTSVRIMYSLQQDSVELIATISLFQPGRPTRSKFINIPKLPHADLCENNLSLFPKIEQQLLLMDNNQLIFHFEHDQEYFVYRNELSNGLIKKTIQVQAISRFPDFYPDADPADFLSEASEVKELFYKDSYGNKYDFIPNNVIPATPIFHLQPLLFHENIASKNGIERKRSMQVMFEIDRPLRTGEKFAIIASSGINKVTEFTSAIGRDMTTYENTDFATDALPEGIPIDTFIVNNSSLEYIGKYFDGPTISIEQRKRTIGGYSILPLEPYYEKINDKWIAVMAINQDMLRDNNKNAYNPFIKIIAASFIENSTKGNFISEFSKPKYINLLSERIVKVTSMSVKDEDYWYIEISNLLQVKRDNQYNQRTKFVVCLRERSNHGISGDVVKSKNVKGQEFLFHVFDQGHGGGLIRFQKRKVLCIYEFETFDNTPGNIDNVAWLQDPRTRMMYAEEF